jgi:hypothetical protein
VGPLISRDFEKNEKKRKKIISRDFEKKRKKIISRDF